ncbi:MAG: 3-carboxy-cis,cis-muconate cycloisomerase, partial [Bacteroidetes bacterium]|nr:3-carboxy-cis,cis-muconate cycloisomerase [Bacteroidota bacterium]
IQAKPRILKAQLGGAVGSRGPFISREVVQEFANILSLQPATPWHTHRDHIAEFGTTLAILSGSLGKIAKDISLLMQTEVGEVFEGKEPGKGGSSTMPHKRNQVTCAAILANTHRVPFLTASLLAGMPQEHERSAGLWHAEWETLAEIMALTAGSLTQTNRLLENLEVDESRMLANLDLTHGLIFAEVVSFALAPKIGKKAAYDLVQKACSEATKQQKHLKDILLKNQSGLNQEELAKLFQPENALGNSLEIIDIILKKCKSPENENKL